MRDRLFEQRALTGATYAGCQILFGTMRVDDAIASAELLSTEVVPALAAPVRQPAAAA